MSIYLDSAATTKPKQEVIETIISCMNNDWYNPSSLYNPSKHAKKIIEESRKKVANFIRAKPEEIYFTSSGSESNCWAIQGFIHYWKGQGKEPVIITSTIEHKSIISCVKSLTEKVYFVSVSRKGIVNIKLLENILKTITDDEKVLVSIQYANNECGTIQDIESLVKLVHSYNGIFHTDAVQAFGHIDINLRKINVDMLSASGHKIGMMKGIGMIYIKNGIKISPIIYGSQEQGFRGGTENTPYIAGFAEAVKIAEKDILLKNKIEALRNYFTRKLVSIGCKVNGTMKNRLPNNINITFPQNITGEAMIYLLDMCDIYISAGSACNSESNEPSHVLKAMGLSDEEATRTIRISLPYDITREEIDKALIEIQKQVKLITTDIKSNRKGKENV